jgi:methyltransferase (TIGR00027 family)
MQVNPRHRPSFFFVFSLLLAAMVLIVHVPTSQALKPGEVSLYAEVEAAYRAVAAQDPDEKIRNPDHLAIKLLPPNFWLFGFLHKDYARSIQGIKFFRAAGYYTVNASTKHIDGLLQKFSQNGLQQVVNIGAGFDSRPYRMGEQMPGVHFFEIDLPATSAAKQAAIQNVFGKLPQNVTYIPVDYRTGHFLNTLKKAGYDENRKTLFIWEGISQFMDEKIVDTTLRYIAQRTNSENKVIFSYIPAEFVRGEYGKMGWVRFRELRARAAGEPWKFGIPHQKTGEFFDRRGFKVIADLGARELAGKYLIRSDGNLDGKPTPYVRIAYAGVSR